MPSSTLQRLAIFYSALFIGVVALNYVPQIHDADGNMFGLFHLDLIDDALHIGSALWALLAGLSSYTASRFYFRWFGLAYLLDGVLGILAGKGYLDLGIFMAGPGIVGLSTRIAANIPHIVLGGVAVVAGFLAKKN